MCLSSFIFVSENKHPQQVEGKHEKYQGFLHFSLLFHVNGHIFLHELVNFDLIEWKQLSVISIASYYNSARTPTLSLFFSLHFFAIIIVHDDDKNIPVCVIFN